MPADSYSFSKSLEVTSTGFNSNSRSNVSATEVYAVKIVSGSNSTTGTGDIEIDDSNVSSKNDIAITDSNDNTLDYYWEDFDTANGEYLAWVKISTLTRDDTVGLKVFFGNGSTDEAATEATVFDGAANLTSRYSLSESSGTTLDSTSNNNDSTSTTGTVFNKSQEFNGGRGFDGTDDVIEVGSHTDDFETAGSLVALYESTSSSWGSGDNVYIVGTNDPGFTTFNIRDRKSSGEDNFTAQVSDGSSTTSNADVSHTGYTEGNTQMIAGVFEDSSGTGTLECHVYGPDGGENTGSDTVGYNNSAGTDFRMGAQESNSKNNNCDLDEVRTYNVKIADARMDALWDMAPSAGQVLFSQQAAQSTTSTTIDTANTASAVSTSQTSTELVNNTDTATVASATSSTITSSETNTVTDTVTTASAISSTITTSETADYVDTVKTASAISSTETSTELIVQIDSVTKASGVSSTITTTETFPVTDNATKADAVSSTITTTETKTDIDTVTTASAVSTTITSSEISDATDTVSTASANTSTITSSETIKSIDTVTKADAVSSTITTNETTIAQGPEVSYPLTVVEESMDKFIKDA